MKLILWFTNPTNTNVIKHQSQWLRTGGGYFDLQNRKSFYGLQIQQTPNISSNIKARKWELEVVTFDLELVFQILDDGLKGMLLHHLGGFKYFKIVCVFSFIFKYLRLSSCSPITFHSNGIGVNLSLVSLFTFHQPSSKIIHFVLQISYHDSPKVMLDLLRLLFSKYIMIWKCQM